jgi:hypothetical protein
LLLAPLVLAFISGCAYTVAGTKLPPLVPPAASFQPRVEHTVGDFSFTLEGGAMVTSEFVGRQLNGQITRVWKDRGYIREEKGVDHRAFSGTADYNVTLTGTQYGESSLGMQILSGLTLFLVPTSTTQHYDLQYTVEDVKTHATYGATVKEEDKTYMQLFLLFTLPVAGRGHQHTMERVAEHLYDQLHRQGLFQAPQSVPTP